MTQNFARLTMTPEVVTADALTWEPARKFDGILLDAPCSATGIFRRHPDVLHRVRPRAIAELAGTQAAMLARAAGWLKPGGRLVYSVCSLERQEGEQVVGAFLEQRDDFAIAEEHRLLPGRFEAEGGADSFFIALLTRAGPQPLDNRG
jgi:16S rRNA (cytosine967-C5)-methyltransferase